MVYWSCHNLLSVSCDNVLKFSHSINMTSCHCDNLLWIIYIEVVIVFQCDLWWHLWVVNMLSVTSDGVYIEVVTVRQCDRWWHWSCHYLLSVTSNYVYIGGTYYKAHFLYIQDKYVLVELVLGKLHLNVWHIVSVLNGISPWIKGF